MLFLVIPGHLEKYLCVSDVVIPKLSLLENSTKPNLDTVFRGNSPPVAQHLQSTALPPPFLIRQPPPLPQFRFNRMPIQQVLLPGIEREIPMMHRMPFMGQPDFRIYEMNRRLQQWSQDVDNLWWDTFATEFFEDDATLTLAFYLEDGLKKYTIGRTLIPRYFRSLFEGGVVELFFVLKHSKEICHSSTIILDCEQTSMVAHHTRPIFTKVLTEGRLVLEMTFDDLMRIRTWHFAIHHHYELIPRSVVAMRQQDPGMADHLAMNITRQGLTNYTLNFLRLCVILEPMQELMSRHKAYGLSPRDCLKTTLFQKWQRMVAPPEANRQSNRRKKRKSSSASTTNCSTTTTSAPCSTVSNNGVNPNSRSKRVSPEPQMFNSILGDVMVVGEPTLMGGEFGDKDERLIARLENSQYDPSNDANPSSQDHHGSNLNNGMNSSNRLDPMVQFEFLNAGSPVGVCTTAQQASGFAHNQPRSSPHDVYYPPHSQTSNQKRTPPASVWPPQQDANRNGSSINPQQQVSSDNFGDKSPKNKLTD